MKKSEYSIRSFCESCHKNCWWTTARLDQDVREIKLGEPASVPVKEIFCLRFLQKWRKLKGHFIEHSIGCHRNVSGLKLQMWMKPSVKHPGRLEIVICYNQEEIMNDCKQLIV